MTVSTAAESSLLAAQVASAQRVLDELGGRETFAFAMLSGSVAAGLGHANSDVDLHVIRQPGVKLTRHGFDAGDRMVQFTYLDSERLGRYVNLIAEYVATRDDRWQVELPEHELWHVIRVAVGRLLWADDELAAVLKRIDGDVARQVVAANFASPVARASENADGMLARADLVGALHAAACAMLAACEVALAATGDIYAIDRFLGARLARNAVLSPRLQEIWHLIHELPSPTEGDEALRRSVSERVSAANALSSYALLYGWERPLDSLPDLLWGFEGPRRSLEFGLLRFSDAFALAGPKQSLRVGKSVAAVWAALDGSPLETVTEKLGRQGHEMSADQVAEAVARLTKSGAAEVSDRTVSRNNEKGGD